MRVALGLLLLLLCLCGSGAQGEHVARRDEESTLQDTCGTVWAELRELREMVVTLRVELAIMTARVSEGKSQVDIIKAELTATKGNMEQLQRENSGT